MTTSDDLTKPCWPNTRRRVSLEQIEAEHLEAAAELEAINTAAADAADPVAVALAKQHRNVARMTREAIRNAAREHRAS